MLINSSLTGVWLSSRYLLFLIFLFFQNWPISQNPTMHHTSIPQCTILWQTISVTKWCIVGYWTGALWDLWDRSIINTQVTYWLPCSYLTVVATGNLWWKCMWLKGSKIFWARFNIFLVEKWSTRNSIIDKIMQYKNSSEFDSLRWPST